MSDKARCDSFEEKTNHEEPCYYPSVECQSRIEEAVSKNQFEELRRIVQGCDESTARDNCCIKAVKLASCGHNWDFVKFVILHLCSKPSSRDSCCVQAAKEAKNELQRKVQLEMFQFFLENVCDENLAQDLRISTAKAAAHCRDWKLVKKYIDAVTNSVVKNECCMELAVLAANHKEWKVVKFLIEQVSDKFFSEKCCMESSSCWPALKSVVMKSTLPSDASETRLYEVFKFLERSLADSIAREQCRKLCLENEMGLKEAEQRKLRTLTEPVEHEEFSYSTCIMAARYASMKGYDVEVKRFLKKVTDESNRREFCMICVKSAARFCRPNIVHFLLEECSFDKTFKHTCCKRVAEVAASCGYFDLAKSSIQSIDDLETRNECCLTVAEAAAADRHITTMKFIADFILDDRIKYACCAKASEPAARNVDKEAVEDLVRNILDQNMKDQCGKTAAKAASASSAWEVVKFLIEFVQDASMKDEFNASAAESAAWNGDCEQTLIFLKNIVDISVKDRAFLRSVESAAENLKVQVVALLLHEASSQQQKEQCCLVAAKHFKQNRYLEFTKFLVSTISDEKLNSQCCLTTIETAALHNHTKVIKYIIQAVVEPSMKQQCRLKAAISAARRGHSRVISYLSETLDNAKMKDELHIAAAESAAQSGSDLLMSSSLMLIEDEALKKECKLKCAIAGASFGHEEVVHRSDIELRHLVEFPEFIKFLFTMALDSRNSILNKTLESIEPVQCSKLLYLSISHRHLALAFTILESKRIVKDFVDLPYGPSSSTALMLAADAGYEEIIEKLLNLGASVSAEDSKGKTALSRACEAGHVKAAKSLLQGKSYASHRDASGRTCAQLAKKRGHLQLSLMLLSECLRTEDVSRDKMLSMDLRELLRKSGFTRQRAKCQQVMADILQRMWIVLCRDDRQISGSYAEGWANSLVRVNGRTGADSDIDWTVLLRGIQFHLEGGCKRLRHECATTNQVAVTKGHAQVPVGSGSEPAATEKACGVRPRQDLCFAIPCCSTFGSRIKKLNISNDHLLHVHLVQATSAQSLNEFRISFSAHEFVVMRNLSETQGQLFTIIKFCFKRYLPVTLKTPGLKTYHAKTLLLFMLQKHGVEEWREAWQTQNLIARLKESLDMMLSFIDDPNSSPDECMPHFFMPDAPLYFKNAGLGGSFDNTKTRVRERLFELRCDIDEFIEQIKGHMKPLQTEKFYFHPFTLLPLTPLSTATAVRSRRQDQYMHLCDVYCVVHQCLQDLQSKDCSRDDLMRQLSLIDQLQWCRCTVSCLTAMVHLKFDEVQQAEVVLTDLMAHAPQGAWKPEQFLRGLAMDWEAPVDSDWAWRFCFPADTPPSLPFLPEFTQTLFTARPAKPRSEHLYVNFRCLSWSLQAELLRNRTAIDFGAWLSELQEDPDLEELLTLAHYSNQLYQLSFCKQQIDLITSMRRFAVETQDKKKIRWVSEKLERIRQANFSSI